MKYTNLLIGGLLALSSTIFCQKNNSDIFLEKGKKVYEEQNDSAIFYLQKAIGRDECNPASYDALSDIYLQRGQDKRAMSCLMDYLYDKKNSDLEQKLQKLWEENNKPKVTLNAFKNAFNTAIYPVYGDSVSQTGIIFEDIRAPYIAANKKPPILTINSSREILYSFGEEVLQTIIDNYNKSFIQPHLKWTNFYIYMEQYSDALKELNTALEDYPENKILQKRLKEVEQLQQKK